MELERPVQSPHQIHISRIYFIGRQIGSLPNGRLRTGLPPRLSCGWRRPCPRMEVKLTLRIEVELN
jgi:hypothetical protein